MNLTTGPISPRYLPTLPNTPATSPAASAGSTAAASSSSSAPATREVGWKDALKSVAAHGAVGATVGALSAAAVTAAALVAGPVAGGCVMAGLAIGGAVYGYKNLHVRLESELGPILGRATAAFVGAGMAFMMTNPALTCTSLGLSAAMGAGTGLLFGVLRTPR